MFRKHHIKILLRQKTTIVKVKVYYEQNHLKIWLGMFIIIIIFLDLDQPIDRHSRIYTTYDFTKSSSGLKTKGPHAKGIPVRYGPRPKALLKEGCTNQAGTEHGFCVCRLSRIYTTENLCWFLVF